MPQEVAAIATSPNHTISEYTMVCDGNTYVLDTEKTITDLATELDADGINVTIENNSLANMLARGLVPATDSATAYYPQSLLWLELLTYAWALDDQRNRIEALNAEMYLDTADGNWLDAWGSYFGTARLSGEVDQKYCARIVREVTYPNQNNKALEQLVDYFFSDYYTPSPLVDCNVDDAHGTRGNLHYNGMISHNGQYLHNGDIIRTFAQFLASVWCELSSTDNTVEQMIGSRAVIDRKKSAGTNYDFFIRALIEIPSGTPATAIWTTTTGSTVTRPAKGYTFNGTLYAAPALYAEDFWTNNWDENTQTRGAQTFKSITSVTIKNAGGTTLATKDIRDFQKTTAINFYDESQLHDPRAIIINPIPVPYHQTSSSLTLTIGGHEVTAYKYRIDAGAWSAETAIATPITLTGLSNGTHTVDVIGKNTTGTWQATATSATWLTDTSNPIAILTGAPESLTKRDYDTVTVSLTSGTGGSYRWRLDYGAWSSKISTSTPITLTGIKQGNRVLQVRGYSAGGKKQSGYTSHTFRVDTDRFRPTAVISNSLETMADPTTPVIISVSGTNIENTDITHFKWRLGRGSVWSTTVAVGNSLDFTPDKLYLAMNSDAAAAVEAGTYPDGVSHWLAIGEEEGRYYPHGIFKLFVIGMFAEDEVEYWQKIPTVAMWRTKRPGSL